MPVSLFERIEQLREDPGGREALEFLEPRAALAANVYRLRTQRGWTQGQLAEKAGMKQPRIADIENRLGNPRLHTITRVALALGVSAATLLQIDAASGTKREGRIVEELLV
jgi:transcriptional regulator with XRE-family HTH domain